MCYMNRLEFACLAYIHSGKCTYHMCTNEERLSMSQEIYLRSTLVKWWIVHWKSCTMKECEHLKCVLLDISRVVVEEMLHYFTTTALRKALSAGSFHTLIQDLD